MSLDFRQVQQQVHDLGETAPQRQERQREQRSKAQKALAVYAGDCERLRQKIDAARVSDPTLRCARPLEEALDAHFPPPLPPQSATLLAADGSQINPDRHAEVAYCLINVGVIQMRLGAPDPPVTRIHSRLLYDNELLNESMVALRRDLSERTALAETAANLPAPVIAFTDGPMELWGAKDEVGSGEYEKSLAEYLAALENLRTMEVTNAGYVDKPGADLLARLLEVALTPEEKLRAIRQERPLKGVADRQILGDLLQPGERSAVFAIQSKSAENYPGPLALHFFYLNVGRPGRPWLARVEAPRWVCENRERLNALHGVLLHQCQIMGGRPYPYLLHRAHETAVVTQQEKEQVTQMILIELRRRGVEVDQGSHKQAAKNLSGRTRLT